MNVIRSRPEPAAAVAGAILLAVGVVVYVLAPEHNFGFVGGAPFNPFDLFSGQQKAGLTVALAGALLLSLAAGLVLGRRLERRGKG